MFERFTDRARKVMALANQEAQRFNHEYIGVEHILLGIVKEGSGVAATILMGMGVDLRRVRLEVEKRAKSAPEMVMVGKLPQTPRAKRVIEYAIEEARELNHRHVGTEHLLLGLLRESEGLAAEVLATLGVNLAQARAELLKQIAPELEQPSGSGGSAAPIEMVLRNDVAAGLMHVLLCELISRRSAAKLAGDHDLVGEYKGIIRYIEAAQESLIDLLRRRHDPAAR